MSRKPKLLPIHIYGDKVLRLKSEEVQKIDENLLQFAEDLIATMYQWDGVGLSAHKDRKNGAKQRRIHRREKRINLLQIS